VLDTDHEDMLARLAIYTLAKPSPKFLPLLRPLFTAQTIPDMLLVILLDWADPWNWIRQLLSWIRLLHALLRSLPAETVQALQDNIVEWRDRKRNDAKDAGAEAGAAADAVDVVLPLGPGEWDSPLGVPLCVVCQNANAIEALERESGWKDRHFDFVQQFVRTVLLKHGGSLVYTMPHQATAAGSPLQTLVHSSLGIESMLKKKTLKYNTTDRDHILVPPNFDSWGKIRILTDDFNVEEVSEAWTQDIKDVDAPDDASDGDAEPRNPRAPHDAVSIYEDVIKNPKRDQAVLPVRGGGAQGALEVQCQDAQLFLGEQAEILDELGREDERAQRLQESKKNLGNMAVGDIEEHIGPVQFNMGGIQIDAEDQLKKLKVCLCLLFGRVTDEDRIARPAARRSSRRPRRRRRRARSRSCRPTTNYPASSRA
jgi:dynein light intermediate chain 1